MSVSFYYPFEAPIRQVRVRNPILGDSVSTNPLANIKVAMDGGYYSYISTPVINKFTLAFEGLTRRKILEIQAFLKEAIGDYIRYIDKDTLNWKIKFLTDPIEYTTPGRGLGLAEPRESNSIILNFEGEAI